MVEVKKCINPVWKMYSPLIGEGIEICWVCGVEKDKHEIAEGEVVRLELPIGDINIPWTLL